MTPVVPLSSMPLSSYSVSSAPETSPVTPLLNFMKGRAEVLHRPGPAALLGHAAKPVDIPRQQVQQVEVWGEVVQQRPLVLGPPPGRGLAAVHVAVDVVQVADRALVEAAP